MFQPPNQPIAGPSIPRSFFMDSFSGPSHAYSFGHQSRYCSRPGAIIPCPNAPTFTPDASKTSQSVQTWGTHSGSSPLPINSLSSAPCSIQLPDKSHHSVTQLTLQDSTDIVHSSVPSRLRFKPRLADHLVSAPGVSFARSLSFYSSPLGTIPLVSRIAVSVKRTSHELPRSITHDEATLNGSVSLSSPEPATSVLITVSSNCDESLTHPTIHPVGPTSTNPTVSQAKTRTWADLLRTGPSTHVIGSHSSSPSLQCSPAAGSYKPFPLSTPCKAGSKDELNSALMSDKLQRAKKSWSAPFLIPRGLINNGNMCFANAVLQVLVHCPPFYNLIVYLAKTVPHDFGSRTPLLEAMIAFLQEFQALDQPDLATSSPLGGHTHQNAASPPPLPTGQPFIAESVWAATVGNSRFDAMRRGQQEDAQEFLCFFLDTLHEEMLIAIERHDRLVHSQKDSPATTLTTVVPHLNVDQVLNAGDWTEVGSKGRSTVTRSTVSCHSPLSQIFEFRTRSVLHRLGQKDSVTFEPNNMLQLSIEHPSVMTIEQALAHFSSPDVISDMKTQNGQRVAATKQVYIETFPPVLILHIKRFNYDSEDGLVKKNHKEIHFNIELNIPASMRSPSQRNGQDAQSDVTFKLFAAVYHHGHSASGGHYTVAIRQQLTNTWVYIDDTNVSPISTTAVLASAFNKGQASQLTHANAPHLHASTDHQNSISARTPYLLFYTRC